jgi:hypothetical protein
MHDEHESKEEMVERLTRQFRELLEKKLPEAPGTLEEIERVTEEIGTEIKREIEDECLGWHGSGYIGSQVTCSCGGVSKFKNHDPMDRLPWRCMVSHRLSQTSWREPMDQLV